MSRRRAAVKREVLPDAKFGDSVLTKFMNCLMYECDPLSRCAPAGLAAPLIRCRSKSGTTAVRRWPFAG